MAPDAAARGTVAPGAAAATGASGPDLVGLAAAFASPASAPVASVARTSLPGNPLTPAAGRRFVRAALADWTALALPAAATVTERVADDAVLVADELVTNAVVHAGTTVELLLRLEDPAGDQPAALVLEVSDRHPARTLHGQASGPDAEGGFAEYGRGLHLVGALAECWGITYRTGRKTVWARLALDGGDVCPVPGPGPALQRGLRAAGILAPAPRRTGRDDHEWISRGGLSFLAEASDLLAGQLDEDMVAALAAQLLVPRFADWCAFWLDVDAGHAEPGGPSGRGAEQRLARVWHTDESAVEELRRGLEKEPPRLPDSLATGPVRIPWPPGGDLTPGAGTRGDRHPTPGAGTDGGDGTEVNGTALAYRLVARGRAVGTLVLGRRGLLPVPESVTALMEDFARRVALAIGAARQYTRQVTISRVLQRGLLPGRVARIPGVDSRVVYEPSDDGLAGGDFYDVFEAGPGARRWCFMLGDVQGSGPEAAVVTGLARPWLRLLAREGHPVGEVLDRLNRLLLDDATEAAEAAARLAAAAPASFPEPPPPALGTALPDSVRAAGLPESVRAAGLPGPPPGHGVVDGTLGPAQARFLSLLYGELVPLPPEAGGGARCTLACAGHPLPLLLRPDGSVTAPATPQVLLGVVDDVAYESHTFDLAPGDTLLCVTDGVTERRSRGGRMFDDGDGLALALADCAGLGAQDVADRLRQAVHAFGEGPVRDDLALLVLQAQHRPR
ncbi:SpoIIE family protein phosphatase [Streptomyces sp. NPDC047928]|uniref:SpoIIE family protein phosphatase n=1 Tax=unclassified Streptomyces TaxID=2593676 RepID=UPI00371658C9